MEKFDGEEASKQIETPGRILNFDDCKSAVMSEMKAFDQNIMKNHQSFQICVAKRSISDSIMSR